MSGVLDQVSTRRRFLIAGAMAACLFVAACAALPFAGTRLPVIVPFIPMFETTVILVEGLTCFFLAIQYRALRQAYFGGLAGAYGFVMVMAAIQFLVFPGAFTPTGLLGAGPQSAVWLWVFWHGGFPAMVILALLTRTAAASRWLGALLPRTGLLLMAAGPLLAVSLAYFAIHRADLLPVLIRGTSYQNLRDGEATKIVIATLLLAGFTCIRVTRVRDLLSLWVAVALLASLGDTLLVLAGSARYSLGWYGGRVLSVISSSVVLCALIFEFTRAYERVLASNAALAERAMRDGLTGAFNRLYFEEQFARELRRTVRDRAPMSVLMIDVDHFKSYNDMRGHQMGDRCLIAVVRALEAVLRRPGDFVARYGGEEFVAVMPRTGAEGALALAEAMRRAVAALGMRRDSGVDGTVTVSIGGATIDPAVEDFSPAELIRHADAALYQAKNAGRDRVVISAACIAAKPPSPVPSWPQKRPSTPFDQQA
jgi:diguanylate cyclase (GGDEF)-like protein